MLVCIPLVHPEKIGRKQGRLVAARTRPEFEDRALFVGRILRQKLDLELLFKLGDARLQPLEIFARKLRHFLVGLRIGHHGFEVDGFLLGGLEFANGRNTARDPKTPW